MTIDELVAKIESTYPSASVEVNLGTVTWIDIYLGDEAAVLEWRPSGCDFGVSVNTIADACYGEFSDEFYKTEDEALARFFELFGKKGKTRQQPGH